MDTAGWDIDARFPEGTSPTETSRMMQAMLADRFRLVTHRETRTLPIYVLTVSKGGFKLHPGKDGGGMSAGPGLLRYDSGTLGALAGQLSHYLGRNVIDRTGMTGHYAIDLSFALVSPGAPGSNAAQDFRPSIFQGPAGPGGAKA